MRLTAVIFCSLERPSAGSRRATARSDLSACRAEQDAGRDRLHAVNILGEINSATVAASRRDGNSSLDECTDPVRERVKLPSQRRAGGGEMVATDDNVDDERVVASCKAKVAAFMEKVRQVSTEQRQRGQPPHRVDFDQGQAERLLTQARAFWRAISGDGGTRRLSTGQAELCGDDPVQESLEALDVALLEADRLRPDRGLEGSRSCDSFVEVAQKASRAAQEVQKAVVETDVKDAGARAECARALVRLAEGDVDDLEAEIAASGLDGERSVREAVHLARRRLEEVSSALGGRDKEDAGRTGKGQAQIEAMVASRTLATALSSVDAARSEISKMRQVLVLETKAKNILIREASRTDELSRQSQDLGLLERPAVAQAVQACRAAVTAAERYESLGRTASLSLDKREELTQAYMSAALQAGEMGGIAEETLAAERDARAEDDESRRRLEKRLKQSKSSLHRLQDRLSRLAAAAKQRNASLEGAQTLAASWKMVSADKLGPLGLLPAEPDGAAAGKTTAEAFRELENISRQMNASWNVTYLEKQVELGLQMVIMAEAATTEAEIQGRRRDLAIAALNCAARKTHSLLEDAQEVRVVGRPAVAESLSHAACVAREGLLVAVESVLGHECGHVEADEPLLDAACRAEAAAEAAAEVVSLEKMSIEQEERERQERCAELWSASRRLEEMDTASVVGDYPEAAAMVLKARSEVVQVRRAIAIDSISRQLHSATVFPNVFLAVPIRILSIFLLCSEWLDYLNRVLVSTVGLRFLDLSQALVALEGADDPAHSIGDAQVALEYASSAEECFVEAQRKVRCFDAATGVLEEAEVRVLEVQTAMKAGSVLASDNCAAFQEALAKYEGMLNATVASSDRGADTFLEACNAAFAAAREVERAAMKERRRARARLERRRRELARLDRPAAALMALDLSELAEAPGEKNRESYQAVAEAIRDALSAIALAREEVSEGRQELEEEAALAVRVDGVIQAASSTEHAFLSARERVRREEQWKRELARTEATLSTVKTDILTLPDAGLVLELCAASMRAADKALVSAKEGVAASTGGEVALVDVEAMLQGVKAKVGTVRREAEEQASGRVWAYWYIFRWPRNRI